MCQGTPSGARTGRTKVSAWGARRRPTARAGSRRRTRQGAEWRTSRVRTPGEPRRSGPTRSAGPGRARARAGADGRTRGAWAGHGGGDLETAVGHDERDRQHERGREHQQGRGGGGRKGPGRRIADRCRIRGRKPRGDDRARGEGRNRRSAQITRAVDVCARQADEFLLALRLRDGPPLGRAAIGRVRRPEWIREGIVRTDRPQERTDPRAPGRLAPDRGTVREPADGRIGRVVAVDRRGRRRVGSGVVLHARSLWPWVERRGV